MLKRCSGAELSPYMKIMISLTVVEVNYAFKNIMEYGCFLRQSLVRRKVASVIALFYGDSVTSYKQPILTVAFNNRWWALARSFSYPDGVFAKYLWLWFISPCALLSCSLLMRDLMSSSTICMDLLYVMTNVGIKTYTRAILAVGGIFLLFITILFIFILKELKSMQKLRVIQNEDQNVQDATRTVVVITLTLYISLVIAPLVLYFTHFETDGSLKTARTSISSTISRLQLGKLPSV